MSKIFSLDFWAAGLAVHLLHFVFCLPFKFPGLRFHFSVIPRSFYLQAPCFNTEIYSHYLETFLYQNEFKILVKEKSCLKSVSNPGCKDLFLLNNALSFQSTKTVSTGLSDFHKLLLTVFKSSVVKNKP